MPDRRNSEERRARAAQIQDQHRRAERRRSMLIVGTAIGVAAVLVGTAVIAVMGEQDEQDRVEAAAKQPIDGVEEYKKLSRNHVNTPVDYPQTPAVGGDHAPIWANCGAYTSPVEPTQAVHSLEHGAVWVGYDPALPDEQVEELTRVADSNSYVLLSPVEGVPEPVTVSAWGKQLGVKTADDPRVAAFIQKYQQGPQTPEPGAACTGGAGGM